MIISKETELINDVSKPRFTVNVTNTTNKDYEVETTLHHIGFEEMYRKSIFSHNGFIITEPQGVSKMLKSKSSILSEKFGRTDLDTDSYIDRYRCECGNLMGKINKDNNIVCEICHTPVNFVGDNYKIKGWMPLPDGKMVIHPTLYDNLSAIIGKDRLPAILQFKEVLDENGIPKKRTTEKNNIYQFDGIGITEFISRIDEILTFFTTYKKPTKSKLEHLKLIRNNMDKLFTKYVPAYTLLLRPVTTKNGTFIMDGDNNVYNSIAKNSNILNMLENESARNNKRLVESALYDIHSKWLELKDRFIKKASGKTGFFRSLFGNRFIKTARSVITPDHRLRVDEVRLPYPILVILFDQQIINILKRSYNIRSRDAFFKWWLSQQVYDEVIAKILEALIANGRGIPVAICRNPSIAYGSTMQMYCVGINKNYTMSIPMQILPTFNADFDGDCMNILSFINDEFLEACKKTINPRNSFFISRNDGSFNNDLNFARDVLVLSNSLINSTRGNYSKEELANLYEFKYLR